MPKSIATLRNFSGGINNQYSPRDIQDNEFSYATDIVADRIGVIRTMGNGEGTPKQINDYSSNKTIGTLGSTDIQGSIVDATCDFNNDPTISMDDTAKIEPGMLVVGSSAPSGIPSSSTVSSITNATTFELSQSTTGGSKTNQSLVFTGKRANATGYGFKHFELDYDELERNIGEHYLAVVSSAGVLNVWDYTFNSWSSSMSLDLGSSTNCKALITPIDNGIRVTDTELTNTSQIKYYMYVERSQIGRDRKGFYVGNNTLPAPSSGNLVTSNTYTDGAINFKIDSQVSGEGSWERDNYAFAYTFVYDGNQESAPYVVSTAKASSTVNANRPLKVTVYAANATGATDYDARISGARIYWKKYDSTNSKVAQGEWNLLVDVDLTGSTSDNHAYGIRSKLGDKFTNWSVSSNDAIATIIINDPPIDTYATLNGYRSSDGALIIGNSGDSYKTAVFANRRMFVANIIMTGADGVQIHKADRIMYSPVNKPDVFPESHFIDIIKGDAEEYIKLEFVGDRLFAFKRDNLFIINISNPSPSGWYLESSHKSMGILHPAAVFKTDFGLTWVNRKGLFVYQDGGGISELTEGKILNGDTTDSYGLSSWAKYIDDDTIIGYSAQDKEIIININSSITTDSSTFGLSGGDIILYDLETRSFWFGEQRLKGGAFSSNFDYDWNGDLIYASEASDTVTIRAWQSASQTSGNVLFSTKDFDFGTPAKKKKIYSVFITYEHSDSNNISNFLSYATNGVNTWATTDGDGSTAIGNNTLDQATSPEIHKFTFTTPIECQSIAFKFNGPSTATKLEIQDISIEYRELYGKVSST